MTPRTIVGVPLDPEGMGALPAAEVRADVDAFGAQEPTLVVPPPLLFGERLTLVVTGVVLLVAVVAIACAVADVRPW